MMALFYEADGAVRRIVKPIVKMSFPLMRAVTLVVGIVLWPLERLFARGLGRRRRNPPE